MKLIDIMRQYNKCVLRENAKLKSIYNKLIKECDGADCEGADCDDVQENDEDGEFSGDEQNEAKTARS